MFSTYEEVIKTMIGDDVITWGGILPKIMTMSPNKKNDILQ